MAALRREAEDSASSNTCWAIWTTLCTNFIFDRLIFQNTFFYNFSISQFGFHSVSLIQWHIETVKFRPNFCKNSKKINFDFSIFLFIGTWEAIPIDWTKAKWGLGKDGAKCPANSWAQEWPIQRKVCWARNVARNLLLRLVLGCRSFSRQWPKIRMLR